MTTKNCFTMKAELLMNPCIQVKPRQPIHEANMPKSNRENDICLQKTPNNNQSGTTSDDNLQQQVRRLREMVILQLDLIHHQQEQLMKKEKQLQIMRKEKQALKLQIEKLEKPVFQQASIKEENNLFNSNFKKSPVLNHVVPHSFNKTSTKSKIKGTKRRFNQSDSLLSESSEVVSTINQSINSNIPHTKFESSSFSKLSKSFTKTETSERVSKCLNSNALTNSLQTKELYYLSACKKEDTDLNNSNQNQDEIQGNYNSIFIVRNYTAYLEFFIIIVTIQHNFCISM
ncbi:uncharacterized protein LOC111638372 isoform X1 [Centruroides sculpturatus]|uniref:uncharacterized protein LOC111638372 isoform X1 n=1 Tax=Centruroides sculpturatus TaxID=218467 RepID=UPI000C6D7AD8|nr:uncharacterized protein LOC111638372 isoform X1 [Centruroides sculpturatus]